MTSRVECGDCLEVMAAMEASCVDAIVTDPPYGLEFMGADWDKLGATTEAVHDGMDASHPFWDGSRRVRYGVSAASMQAWHHVWVTEALRLLKPGGHLLAFGGTRTHHRLMCALEDAGFEIRDCLMWLYGSGFPKSMDISKAIDKAAGVERTATAVNPNHRPVSGVNYEGIYAGGNTGAPMLTAPATDAAKQWQGWGTALKPAYEPIILARKPLSERNLAANVLRWGTGALNIDGCRVACEGGGPSASRRTVARRTGKTPGRPGKYDGRAITSRISAEAYLADHPGENLGRWPANVALDEEAAALLDDQAPEAGAFAPVRGTELSAPAKNVYGEYGRHVGTFYGDTGGASRFFYTAKAARSERDKGLEGVHQSQGNRHPTVKPVALMRWLCRLVTPPKGLVLDPFCGSGTTGIAALAEGFQFIGIERDAAYAAVARARIVGDAPLLNRVALGGGA